MKIDELNLEDGSVGSTSKAVAKVRLKPGDRVVVRLSPLVYIVHLHYLKTRNSVYRCINYDFDGNKVRDDCYLCGKVPTKPYYLFPCLVFSKTRYRYAVLIATLKLARAIKDMHSSSKICDWKLGKKAIITCVQSGRSMSYKVSKIGNTYPLKKDMIKRLTSIDLNTIFFDAWSKKQAQENKEQKETVEMDEEEFFEEELKEDVEESIDEESMEESIDEEDMIDDQSLVDTSDVVDEDEIDAEEDEDVLDLDDTEDLLKEAEKIENLGDDDDDIEI